MKRALMALALLGLFAFPALAETKHYTVMSAFDLDGEGADPDQVVTLANGVIVDSQAAYTITAQPDVCRLHDITVVDTNLDAGTLTVTGTGCLSEARVCSFAFTAGDDTGVKTLTCTDGQGAYFKTITSVATGVMTGESDETFTLGYSTAASNGWQMYGQLIPAGLSGEQGVNPFASALVTLPITTAGVLTTAVTSVAANAAFTDILLGDLLLIDQTDSSGVVQTYERRVTTRTDADNIVVNAALNIPSAGVSFRWKRPYFSTNPYDQLWIPVGAAWDTLALNYSVDSNTDTGGVIVLLECLDANTPDFPTGKWVEIDTITTASAGTQAPTLTGLGPVLLNEAPFSWCRVGLRFGTGDDAADAGVEDVNLSAILRK